MAKVTTEEVIIREEKRVDNREVLLRFKYDIYVSVGGVFSTTLPAEISQLFNNIGMTLKQNKKGCDGYYVANTLEELKKKVHNAAEYYCSREIVQETIVIKYAIGTTGHYVLSKEGMPCPNAYEFFTGLEERRPDDWKEGTSNGAHFEHGDPFSVSVYAQMVYKRIYQYKNGNKKEEYEIMSHSNNLPDENYFGKWLAGQSRTAPGKGQVQEIEYTEEVARFFVEIIRALCMLNERIKPFLDPDSIKMLASTGKKLIG